MPKIVQPLREKTAPAPQCDSTFNESEYREEYVRHRRTRLKRFHPDWDPERCGRGAAYEVRGKHYCSTHAGGKALKILAEIEDK